MTVPLLIGRDIAWTDRENSPRVMLINEMLARLQPRDPMALLTAAVVLVGALSLRA